MVYCVHCSWITITEELEHTKRELLVLLPSIECLHNTSSSICQYFKVCLDCVNPRQSTGVRNCPPQTIYSAQTPKLPSEYSSDFNILSATMFCTESCRDLTPERFSDMINNSSCLRWQPHSLSWILIPCA